MAAPETAEVYGMLAADLESRGVRIPPNDLWIATLCVQTKLLLISRARVARSGSSIEQHTEHEPETEFPM